ncbi:Karyopherin transporter [Mucor velutinosus]|uniref:Karyopherin transporter n=1 Tax=Mucor velutinosus TaxID=708070 RepID=A0AAN7D9N2_9FUNG|nr:Karyopherin transporter [Mucor velutinosus]
MTSFKPNTPNKPETYSIIVPGITPDAALLSEQLLQKNNREFHIFFNEKKFHNHLIHHLLAAYSLGASKQKLQEIFDDHAKDQRPLPPSVGTITRENYTKYLGQADAYASFLTFFQYEVEKNGSIDTVRRWVWSGDMLARTVGGAYHPLIHIGYGLEFGIPGIVAEGLAMASCTEPHFVKIVPDQPPLNTSSMVPAQAQSYAENATSAARGYVNTFVDQLTNQISTRFGISDETTSSAQANRDVNANKSSDDDDIPVFLKENSLFHILNKIRKDPVFDNVVDFKDQNKMQTLLKNKEALDRINHYVNQWTVNDNSKDIQVKFKELYTCISLAVGSTGLRDDHPGVLKLDFFLMHALTSSEFLHQYISRITPSESVSLLHAHLAITIFYYITRGRPNFNVEALLAYKSPSNVASSNNNWLNVFDKALHCQEPHVIKTVRSCAVAQVMYGPHEDSRLNAVWLQVAQMAVDRDGHWDFSGLGFDQNWESSEKH